MAAGKLAIVIAGRRGDWPGGPQTLTPREPTREPNGTLWFGAEFDPAGARSGSGSPKRPSAGWPAETPVGRGRRLLDALIVWITPDRQLDPGINRFEVRVSEAGDTWIECLRW